jgi:hypothetical protein
MRKTWTHTQHTAVAAGLALTGTTQQELADYLAEATGRKWTRGMVANRNTGHPPGWSAEEMALIAELTGLPVWWFESDPRQVAVTSSNVTGAMGRLLKRRATDRTSPGRVSFPAARAFA